VAQRLEWRGELTNEMVNVLHAQAFGHPGVDHDWRAQVTGHSLGWVCAFDDDGQGELVGFVNVAWDGARHAFIVDLAVAAGSRRHGVGTRLVAVAAEHARAAGCEWLHVDFEDGALSRFYFQACGFVPTAAGLLALNGQALPLRT